MFVLVRSEQFPGYNEARCLVLSRKQSTPSIVVISRPSPEREIINGKQGNAVYRLNGPGDYVQDKSDGKPTLK